MNMPGLKDCTVTNLVERDGMVEVYVEMERKPHSCPRCGEETERIHDYRYQKIKHLKWFERMTQLWYKRRRYSCPSCGKRFSEENSFVERYQRTSVEWNQAVSIRSIKAKRGTTSKTLKTYVKELFRKTGVAEHLTIRFYMGFLLLELFNNLSNNQCPINTVTIGF